MLYSLCEVHVYGLSKFQMIYFVCHLMNLCVLSSIEIAQNKHVFDPCPHLHKFEPNGGAHQS